SVTVQFAAPPTPALLKELAAAYKLTEISRPTYLENLVQFELGAPEKADAFRVAELLRDDLGNKILMAEPDLVHEVRKYQAPPVNDEFYDRQWYLKTIRAPEFWKAARPRQEVLVALLDDGVDGTHEGLAGRLVRGRNFVHLGLGVEPDRDAWHPQAPEDNHGTLCAGLIAAVEDNREGIGGVGR